MGFIVQKISSILYVTYVHSPTIPGSLKDFLGTPPLASSVKYDMVSINFSVKIRFKFILFRELEESFMAPLKIPPGVSLRCHQSEARMAERKAERQ